MIDVANACFPPPPLPYASRKFAQKLKDQSFNNRCLTARLSRI